MYEYQLAKSKNGMQVYVNLINSKAGKYISRNPNLLNLIKEILSDIKLSKDHLVVEKDMGRVVGNTEIVETNDKDNIYYAKVKNTGLFCKFAKNKTPAPSRKLTIKFVKDEEGGFEVKNAWIGPNKPPFPRDDNTTKKSEIFWDNHAMVEDSFKIISNTITKTCPY